MTGVANSIKWADINKDGRRLERVIKMMETKAKDEEDKDMQLAYIDRLIKATTAKVHIAEIVLNIKRLLAESNREIKLPIVPSETGVIQITQ